MKFKMKYSQNKNKIKKELSLWNLDKIEKKQIINLNIWLKKKKRLNLTNRLDLYQILHKIKIIHFYILNRFL